MTFKIKRTKGQGIEFEIASGTMLRPSRPFGSLAMPDSAYRKIARATVNGLIEENRQLRHGRKGANEPILLRLQIGRFILNVFARKN